MSIIWRKQNFLYFATYAGLLQIFYRQKSRTFGGKHFFLKFLLCKQITCLGNKHWKMSCVDMWTNIATTKPNRPSGADSMEFFLFYFTATLPHMLGIGLLNFNKKSIGHCCALHGAVFGFFCQRSRLLHLRLTVKQLGGPCHLCTIQCNCSI